MNQQQLPLERPGRTPRVRDSCRADGVHLRHAGPVSSRRIAVLLYLGGLAFLLVSWIFSNPPGASPDEPSHYVRALGTAAGDITGHPGMHVPIPGVTAAQLKDLNDYVRSYPVPAGLAPTTFACNAFKSMVPATCESQGTTPQAASNELSMHASQPPLPYLLAGPLMLAASTPQQADWIGRSVLGFWCLVLLGVPLAMAGRYRARLLLGLTVALTPMAIFTGSILNPSGVETFSSVGFFLSVIAVAEGRFPRGSLAAAAFTGVFVSMSRPFAPLWIIVGLISAAGLVGPGVLWAGVRRRPLESTITTVLIGLGTLSTLLFIRLYASPTQTQTVSFSFGELKSIGEMAVGNFGWLDAPIPPSVAIKWLEVVVAITLAGLIWGNRRERITIVLTTLLNVSITSLLSVLFLLPVNIGPQGRHFLPILVLQPLTSVFVLARQRTSVRVVSVGIPVLLMIGLQVVSWIANSAREGIGTPATTVQGLPKMARALLHSTPWSPPGGFLPWLVLLLAGCLLLALACVQALGVPEATASFEDESATGVAAPALPAPPVSVGSGPPLERLPTEVDH